jgi:hypothetical protein
MEIHKKYKFYLLLALSISLTIIVINNINGAIIIPQIVKDINSGVIGAILTTIITLILLSNQTESQENLTKTSVVYEEKLKIFNNFLETIGKCLEDGKLTSQETQKIIHSFSMLRVHITEENSLKLENAISSINNSFFYVDEFNVPNISRYIELYTNLTNVFRQELYGDKAHNNLSVFEFKNFSEILFQRRTMEIKITNFHELIELLKEIPNLLYRNSKTENTVVYKIDSELLNSFTVFHNFMQMIIQEISSDISLTYETKKHIVNTEIYIGLPYVKLNYKNFYFAHYGFSEKKRLFLGTKIPNSKQIAAIEIYEIDQLVNLKQQISTEIKDLISNISSEQKI